MNNKDNAIFTIAIYVSIILILTVADFFHGDRIYSETENRLLAAKPTFSMNELFSGNYTADYEKYVTDQFVGRDKWIYVKTKTDILLQKKEINGVYLGADNYLIEQHLPQDYTDEQMDKKLALLEQLITEWDATVMLVPTADNIISNKLPANAPYYDERELLEKAAQLAGEDRYVDVYTTLKEHREEDIYYRTDHHWTSLGAYYGYQAWLETTGARPYPYDVNNMVTVDRDFLGTLHSKINLNWRTDSIQYFPETAKRPMKVTYDFQREADIIFEESYLETKNKYGFFLDDNHAIIEIDTPYRVNKTLFVLKDSYANCFIPLMMTHYQKIYVVDPRYYNGRLFDLMEQCEPEGGMDVLVLYNCIHFLEEFNYR